MIPGMGGALREMGDLSPAENEMKRMKVIISSMTKKERQNYKIMKESHIERVARGSGTTGSQVKDFIAKFKQMEQMMGGMMAMMKGGIPSMPGMGHGAKAGFRSTGEDNPFGQKGKKKPGGGNPWGKYF
jgi:signal recognition particle subunit SRP54